MHNYIPDFLSYVVSAYHVCRRGLKSQLKIKLVFQSIFTALINYILKTVKEEKKKKQKLTVTTEAEWSCYGVESIQT